jgi:hypothetical protein
MGTGEGRRTHVEDAGLWIARVRLVVVLFAVADVALMSRDYPSGYEEAAWITTGVFAVGAIALFFASKRYSSAAGPAALVFDALIVATYSTIYSFEYGSPTRWAHGGDWQMAEKKPAKKDTQKPANRTTFSDEERLAMKEPKS